jgi:hypothetical protein
MLFIQRVVAIILFLLNLYVCGCGPSTGSESYLKCAVPPPPPLMLFAKSNGKSNRRCPSVQCAVAVGRGYDGRGGCGMVHSGPSFLAKTTARMTNIVQGNPSLNHLVIRLFTFTYLLAFSL